MKTITQLLIGLISEHLNHFRELKKTETDPEKTKALDRKIEALRDLLIELI